MHERRAGRGRGNAAHVAVVGRRHGQAVRHAPLRQLRHTRHKVFHMSRERQRVAQGLGTWHVHRHRRHAKPWLNPAETVCRLLRRHGRRHGEKARRNPCKLTPYVCKACHSSTNLLNNAKLTIYRRQRAGRNINIVKRPHLRQEAALPACTHGPRHARR